MTNTATGAIAHPHNEEDFTLPDLFIGDWGKINLDEISLGSYEPYTGLTAASTVTVDSPTHDSDKSMSPPTKEPRDPQQQNPHVTKVRTGPGRHPRHRPKPQNMFTVWNQQQSPQPVPMMSPMGFGPTSPFMDYAMQTSPLMNVAMADPTAWMHAGRPRRNSSYMSFGPGGSPSLLYNSFGPQMPSPPFGFQQQQQFFPMYQQTIPMKLPVQALPRQPEPAPQRETTMMAPLVLPADLGRNPSSVQVSKDQVDPAAIPRTISTYLENEGKTVNLGENMQLYEMTFEAFIKEEAQLDYSNVTVVELKKLLRKYQLAATGKKEDLIRMVKDVAAFLKNMKKPGEMKDDKVEEDGPKVGDAPLNEPASNLKCSAEESSEKRDAFLDFIA